MVDEDRMSVLLIADGTSYTWSLKEFVEEAHRRVLDVPLRAAMLAEATPALERALQRRAPPAGGWVLPADCAICGAWPDTLRDDMSTNMNATGNRFPPGVARLLWICGDRRDRSDEHPEMRRCPDCGTYFSIVNSYEWTPLGTDDDDWLTRLKPDQALPFLPEDEKAVYRARLDLDSDDRQ
jgi:hypothetical protein